MVQLRLEGRKDHGGAPNMIFVVAAFVFEEPFGRARAIAFPMIFLARVIYSSAMWREMRAAKAGWEPTLPAL